MHEFNVDTLWNPLSRPADAAVGKHRRDTPASNFCRQSCTPRQERRQVRTNFFTGCTIARMTRWWKYVWALPNTCVGLIFVPFSPGRRIVDGVLELHCGLTSFFLRRCTILPGGAAAMTLGHIVLGVDATALERTRRHERVHVRQCERWGPMFLPAYLLWSLWLLLRRRDFYRDNPFEIAARNGE